MTTRSTDPLVHRLARIEGQVRALKESLETNRELDCAHTLLQVKAATNGLKRFAEALAREHLDRCVHEKTSSTQLAREVEDIIRTAFTLA